MKASEAKALAERANKREYELKKIYAQVMKESVQGKTEVWWYEEITIEMRNELTKQGYKVWRTQFDRNEQLTKISW